MPLSRVLFDDTIELHLDMERVAIESRATIVKLLQKMEQELIAKVANGVTDWSKSRINAQLKEADLIINQYYSDIATTSQTASAGVAQVAASATADSLVAAVGGQVAISAIPTASYLETLAGNTIIQGAVQADWWDRQAGDTAFKFQSAVRQGLVSAETTPQIVRRVRDVMDLSRRNAETLVHTSVQSVANTTREKIFADNDDVMSGKEWSSALDRKTCPTCGALDGKRWTTDGKPIKHSMVYQIPPKHFRCLTGDSLITSADDVTGISKRWFDGKIVVIKTAAGRELTCTPNHPILTGSGWIHAGLLNVGGNVISDGIGKRGTVTNGNNEDIKTTIHDCVESFLSSRKVRPVPMPTTAKDFHGDGIGSKVAVVYSDSFLSNSVNATGAEHICKDCFISRHSNLKRFFYRFCSVDFSGLFYRLSSGSIVRRFGEVLFLLRSAISHTRRLLFAPVSTIYSSLLKCPSNHGSAISKLFGNAANPNSVIKKSDSVIHVDTDDFTGSVDASIIKHPDDSIEAYAKLASELLAGSAGSVFIDDIVNVDIRDFSGHVYNLETVKGWYTANGIITHNCRCSMVPVLRTWAELGINMDELPDGTRASMEGQVSDKTFEDWLKRKTESDPTFADRTLGKGRAELWRNSKITMDQMISGGKPLSLAELKAKYDKPIINQMKNDAYEIAINKDGANHGWYLQQQNLTNEELKNGIKSFSKQINNHTLWISNPYAKIPDFDNLHPNKKIHLVEYKWPQDIQRQKDQMTILKGVLKERSNGKSR